MLFDEAGFSSAAGLCALGLGDSMWLVGRHSHPWCCTRLAKPIGGGPARFGAASPITTNPASRGHYNKGQRLIAAPSIPGEHAPRGVWLGEPLFHRAYRRREALGRDSLAIKEGSLPAGYLPYERAQLTSRSTSQRHSASRSVMTRAASRRNPPAQARFTPADESKQERDKGECQVLESV